MYFGLGLGQWKHDNLATRKFKKGGKMREAIKSHKTEMTLSLFGLLLFANAGRHLVRMLLGQLSECQPVWNYAFSSAFCALVVLIIFFYKKLRPAD